MDKILYTNQECVLRKTFSSDFMNYKKTVNRCSNCGDFRKDINSCCDCEVCGLYLAERNREVLSNLMTSLAHNTGAGEIAGIDVMSVDSANGISVECYGTMLTSVLDIPKCHTLLATKFEKNPNVGLIGYKSGENNIVRLYVKNNNIWCDVYSMSIRRLKSVLYKAFTPENNQTVFNLANKGELTLRKFVTLGENLGDMALSLCNSDIYKLW